jgi:hypothetical protein
MKRVLWTILLAAYAVALSLVLVRLLELATQ